MTATITPFPRAALHDGLRAALRQLIDDGELPPGARIPERALCERFHVSRTPLRECLKVLAAEGLVELLPNRGARVATLEDEHLGHVFEVIGVLEGEAGRLACARIGPAELAELKALHYGMEAHFLRGDMPGYVAANQAIHAAIMAASGNPVLVATHAGLAGRIARARYMGNRLSRERWQAAMEEHRAILAALERRDAAELAALLAEHLRNKRAMLGGAPP